MVGTTLNDERLSQVRAFEDSKAGVKGLTDSGLTRIPKMFYRKGLDSTADQIALEDDNKGISEFQIPVIDLAEIEGDPIKRAEVAKKIGEASSKFGFFQVVNHSIPVEVMDEMFQGTIRFHELGTEEKKQFYTRDPKKKVSFVSNYDLFHSSHAFWKDTLAFDMSPVPPEPEELPSVCREIVIDYAKHVVEVGSTLLELLSEALGLESKRLIDLHCNEGAVVLSHYYPPCPEPELTIGTGKHTDGTFITLLMQDQTGLQVLYQDKWIDVPPVHGALVVNIGDLMQILSNDKYVSVVHRVLSNKAKTRNSITTFFRPNMVGENAKRVYGPIKDLLSDERPAMYRDVTAEGYWNCYRTKRANGPPLDRLKL